MSWYFVSCRSSAPHWETGGAEVNKSGGHARGPRPLTFEAVDFILPNIFYFTSAMLCNFATVQYRASIVCAISHIEDT